jgi:hypothetical protein
MLIYTSGHDAGDAPSRHGGFRSGRPDMGPLASTSAEKDVFLVYDKAGLMGVCFEGEMTWSRGR